MAHAFGKECQRLLLRAAETAHGMGHEYVGTEPILLAVLDERSDALARLWSQTRVDPVVIEAEVRDFLKPSGPPVHGRTVELTPPARECLDLARQEADALGQPEVRAEHLVLGMLRQGEGGIGVSGVILARQGMDLNLARAAVRSAS